MRVLSNSARRRRYEVSMPVLLLKTFAAGAGARSRLENGGLVVVGSVWCLPRGTSDDPPARSPDNIDAGAQKG